MSGLLGKKAKASDKQPALGGMNVQQSAYGTIIPIVYGTNRVTGNLLWYGNFVATQQAQSQQGGKGGVGGGGGGKGGGGSGSYTYSASLAIGICEGPIQGIGTVWQSKTVTDLAGVGGALFTGTNGQSPWGYLVSQFGTTTENHTVPASAPYTITIGSAWTGNTSVSWQSTTVPYAAVGSSPAAQQYSVSAGTYTFNAANAGTTVTIKWIDQYASTVTSPFIIPSTAPYQITVPAISGYSSTVSVNAPPAPFVLTTGTPSAGHYTVTAGVYTFNAADAGAPIAITYTTASSIALGYSNLAYVGFANCDLGSTANTPQFSYEVQGLKIIGSGNQDAYADEVVSDFLDRSAFPTAYIGDLSTYANYTKAMGFFVSPAITSQQQANQLLSDLAKSTNSEFVWSGGLITLAPYGDSTVTGNGVTYTPNLTPVYALTLDDFIRDGDEDPVTCTRSDLADAYNQQPVEYSDRTNQYNIATYTAEDPAHIDEFGIRTASTLSSHHFTNLAAAQTSAQLALWRGLYVRKTYTFKLGWSYILLDPMDLVTLSDGATLENELVRITEIEEDPDTGMLTFTAEEVPGGIAAPALYNTQASTRYTPNYNEDPGSVNPPIVFEIPLMLTQTAAVEAWLAVSGGARWGGCDIWLSTDDQNYRFLERQNGGARQGVLTAPLPLGSAIDQTNTLSIDMTQSNGTFNNTPMPSDATLYNTLSYVDGELLAFGSQTLTDTNEYELSYLARGAYGSTISSHATGTRFARLDDSIFKLPIDQTRIGQTIYLKFVSFNVYGGGLQQISDVSAYSYTVTGNALLTPLPNPANLTTNFIAGNTQIRWDAITDLRSPIDYEIRKGVSFSNSQSLGRTPQLSFPAYGDGTYWVSAHYVTPLGVHVYSISPASIVITGSVLTKNIIATFDEAAGGWTGTCSGGAVLTDGTITLQGAANILDEANVLTITDILFDGGVAPTGTYTSASQIDLAYSANCPVVITWLIRGDSIYDNVLTSPDVLAVTDVLGAQFASLVNAQPQIALSQDGSTFAAWQNYSPGVYTFKSLRRRIVLTTINPQVVPILSEFSGAVDVPDRVDQYSNVSIATGGTTITFVDASNVAKPFNASPNVQVTILNASAGDDAVITAVTVNSVTVQIKNGGVGVVRNVNVTAQSY
jgi:Putative phage tail protein